MCINFNPFFQVKYVQQILIYQSTFQFQISENVNTFSTLISYIKTLTDRKRHFLRTILLKNINYDQIIIHSICCEINFNTLVLQLRIPTLPTLYFMIAKASEVVKFTWHSTGNIIIKPTLWNGDHCLSR